MILYNDNDQQITLPGVRVSGAPVSGAALTATMTNTITAALVFSVPMADDGITPGNYVVQPPIFEVTPGTNYQIVYTGKVQGFELTLVQQITVQTRVR